MGDAKVALGDKKDVPKVIDPRERLSQFTHAVQQGAPNDDELLIPTPAVLSPTGTAEVPTTTSGAASKPEADAKQKRQTIFQKAKTLMSNPSIIEKSKTSGGMYYSSAEKKKIEYLWPKDT